MKKYFVMVVLSFVFSFSLFAVEKEYIPENSVLVVSSKINSISSKAGISTKELMNAIVFNELATNFSEERKDNRVSYSFQNEIVSLLNFEKSSKALMLDTLDLAVIADVIDLEKLDLLMIRIALEERIDILSGDGLTFRYLELDDNLAFAWNKDVFVLLTFLDDSNNYYASYLSDDVEQLGMFETAKLIFSKKSYRKDKTLIDMYNKNNDISAWLDSYYFYKVGIGLSASLYGIGNLSSDIVNGWYKNSAIIVSLDFLNGKINGVMNSYYPNMPIDYTKIKKPLDSLVLKHVNDTAMIGFASMSFNSTELGKLFDLALQQFESSDLQRQLGYAKAMLEQLGIKNYTELMELFGGDVFAYVSSSENGDNALDYLVSVSIKNEAKVLSLLEMVLEEEAEEADGGYYISLGSDLNVYMKDGILYIGNNKSIEAVLNNTQKIELAKTKLDMMKNKTLTIYIDLKYLLNSPYFTGNNVEELFDDVYFTAEYVSKSESKMTVELNLIDKETNALKTIYNAIK